MRLCEEEHKCRCKIKNYPSQHVCNHILVLTLNLWSNSLPIVLSSCMILGRAKHRSWVDKVSRLNCFPRSMASWNGNSCQLCHSKQATVLPYLVPKGAWCTLLVPCPERLGGASAGPAINGQTPATSEIVGSQRLPPRPLYANPRQVAQIYCLHTCMNDSLPWKNHRPENANHIRPTCGHVMDIYAYWCSVPMEHMCVLLYMSVNGCVCLMEMRCALVACVYVHMHMHVMCASACQTPVHHMGSCFGSTCSTRTCASIYTCSCCACMCFRSSVSHERHPCLQAQHQCLPHTRFQIWTVTPWMRPVHVYHFQVIMTVYGFVLLFSADNSLPCLLHASPFIFIHPHPTLRVCRARHPLGTRSISIYFLNTYKSNSGNNEIGILSTLITMQ